MAQSQRNYENDTSPSIIFTPRIERMEKKEKKNVCVVACLPDEWKINKTHIQETRIHDVKKASKQAECSICVNIWPFLQFIFKQTNSLFGSKNVKISNYSFMDCLSHHKNCVFCNFFAAYLYGRPVSCGCTPFFQTTTLFFFETLFEPIFVNFNVLKSKLKWVVLELFLLEF